MGKCMTMPKKPHHGTVLVPEGTEGPDRSPAIGKPPVNVLWLVRLTF